LGKQYANFDRNGCKFANLSQPVHDILDIDMGLRDLFFRKEGKP